MKKITVSLMRGLEKQVLQGEISYSRMIEILNERLSLPESGKDVYTKTEVKERDKMLLHEIRLRKERDKEYQTEISLLKEKQKETNLINVKDKTPPINSKFIGYSGNDIWGIYDTGQRSAIRIINTWRITHWQPLPEIPLV